MESGHALFSDVRVNVIAASMIAKLIWKRPNRPGREYWFEDEATIGSATGNTICINAEGLAENHARIHFDRVHQEFVLEEIDGAGGITVNGKSVDGPVRLEHRQVIVFGRSVACVFKISAPGEESQPQVEIRAHDHPRTRAPGPPPVAGPPQSSRIVIQAERESGGPESDAESHAAHDGQHQARREETRAADYGHSDPRATAVIHRIADPPAPPAHESREEQEVLFLQMLNSSDRRLHRLQYGINTIGRSGECSIQINDRSISRRHAILTVERERILLKDVGSKNHTFLNKERILGEVEVTPGVPLHFGLIEAKVVRSFLNVEAAGRQAKLEQPQVVDEARRR